MGGLQPPATFHVCRLRHRTPPPQAAQLRAQPSTLLLPAAGPRERGGGIPLRALGNGFRGLGLWPRGRKPFQRGLGVPCWAIRCVVGCSKRASREVGTPRRALRMPLWAVKLACRALRIRYRALGMPCRAVGAPRRAARRTIPSARRSGSSARQAIPSARRLSWSARRTSPTARLACSSTRHGIPTSRRASWSARRLSSSARRTVSGSRFPSPSLRSDSNSSPTPPDPCLRNTPLNCSAFAT